MPGQEAPARLGAIYRRPPQQTHRAPRPATRAPHRGGRGGAARVRPGVLLDGTAAHTYRSKRGAGCARSTRHAPPRPPTTGGARQGRAREPLKRANTNTAETPRAAHARPRRPPAATGRGAPERGNPRPTGRRPAHLYTSSALPALCARTAAGAAPMTLAGCAEPRKPRAARSPLCGRGAEPRAASARLLRTKPPPLPLPKAKGRPHRADGPEWRRTNNKRPGGARPRAPRHAQAPRRGRQRRSERLAPSTPGPADRRGGRRRRSKAGPAALSHASPPKRHCRIPNATHGPRAPLLLCCPL